MFRKFILTLASLFVLGCLVSPLPVLAEERLLFAVDLIRHGDRTPLAEFPKFSYKWKEGLGELTPIGMKQTFQLGMQLRKKYIEQYHLLPPHYSVDTLYVRSTDENRALMSAGSLLLGLYPSTEQFLPLGYQPIPIHTVPKKDDRLLLAKPSKNVFWLISYYVSTYRMAHNIPPVLKNKIAYWSQLTGMPVNNLHDLHGLMDNLYIRQLHGIPLPTGISNEDAKALSLTGNKMFLNYFKQKGITYPMGHEFLKTVNNYMKEAKSGKSLLKFVLFSGHDSSIMSVFTTLGIPLQKAPDYASHLNFSLFENNNNYYIKISFNNKPIVLPACPKGYCSLEEFEKLSK